MFLLSVYQATLKEHAEARAYLESRKLASTIERFQLGYANRTLGLRLPHKNRVAGEKLRGHLEQLGVYRQSGHEHLAGSIVVPLVDEAGHVVGMYGRKVLQNLRAGTAKHLYLPGPHRGLTRPRSRRRRSSCASRSSTRSRSSPRASRT